MGQLVQFVSQKDIELTGRLVELYEWQYRVYVRNVIITYLKKNLILPAAVRKMYVLQPRLDRNQYVLWTLAVKRFHNKPYSVFALIREIPELKDREQLRAMIGWLHEYAPAI